MVRRPLIELTIDESDESTPTPCSPYVWIVTIENRDGCAVDADFYTPEEAPGKLADFLSDMPVTIFRYTFEAIDCKLHSIGGDEAIDAILLAFSRYFEDDNTPGPMTPELKIKRDIDFAVTTAWDGKTDRFTLLSDGTLKYPTT